MPGFRRVTIGPNGQQYVYESPDYVDPSSSGSPTSSGGGSSDLLANLTGQFGAATEAANRDSLAQYKRLLNTVRRTKRSVLGKNGLYSQAMGSLQNAGETARADTMDQIAASKANAEQDLMSRGLGNSTIRSSVLGGIETRGQRSLNEIGERVGAQRAGLLTDQAGMAARLGQFKADSILSRVNEAPDPGTYLSLIQRIAASLGSRA